MKILGFLLLLSGWFLVLAAVVLLATAPARASFVAAGLAVEILGMILAIRAHSMPREDRG